MPVETTDFGEMLALTMTFRRCSVSWSEGGPVQAAAAWALVVGSGLREADEDAVVCPLDRVVDLPSVAAADDAEEPPRRESAKTAATMSAITTTQTRRATSRRRR